MGEIIARIYTNHSSATKTLTDYLYDHVCGPTTPVPLTVYFPNLAADQDLPTPYSCGYVYEPQNVSTAYCSYNMSAQVAEGNGYSTMRNLNTWIRTLMKGQNILSPASVDLMKHACPTADPTYGLGCVYMENLGYGHNGARIGNLSLMMYDPVTDVSVVSYISVNSQESMEDFLATIYATFDVAYATREALGYPGKP